MAASIGTETMRGVFKTSLVYGFQYHSYYFLYQLVIKSRYAKRSFLTVFLWYVHSL